MQERLFLLATLFASAMLLSGCDTKTSDASFDQQRFEAYLKLKRIPLNDEARYARMLEDYKRRMALTNAIEKTDFLDKTMLDAEVEAFRNELIASRYFEQFLKDKITDQGIQNFYGSRLEKYQSQKAKVSHILFRVDSKMDETERQVKLTKAREAYSKILTGEDFATIAQAVSEDKVSARKGGSLGWINDGAVSGEFTQKVFAMKKDEVSEPFLTDFGFHIVKVDEPVQQIVKPLDSVKGDIRYQLRAETKKVEIKRLLDSVRYSE